MVPAARPRREPQERPPEGPPGDAGPTFEERLAALEAVVADLEGEDLPLEASLRRYREGVEHLKACRALLDDAERRLAELVAETGPDGSVRAAERPLEATDLGPGAGEERPARARRRGEGSAEDDPRS